MTAARLLAAFLALAATSCGGDSTAAAAKRPPRTARVGVVAATTRDLSYSVDALGTLEAFQVVRVPARLDGVVEEIAFEEGKTVGPQDVIAVVDGVRRDLLLDQAGKAIARAQAALVRSETSVERSAAQAAAAQAGLSDAEGMLARRESARAKAPGLVADEEIEGVRAQVARWKSQAAEAAAAASESAAAVKEAAAAVEEARGRETIAKRDATDARVRPPLSGVVQARHVGVGQWVKAGDPVATLVDVSRLRLRFRVPEAESVALVQGKPEVVFRTAARPGVEVPAELVYVQGSADPVSRMVECLAEVGSPDATLRPGFFASVTVRLRRPAPVVVVPEESLLATEKGLVAYLVGADGRAHAVIVRAGLRTKDGWVEAQEGVPVGASVVVENASVLSDGMAVESYPSAKAGAGAAAGTPSSEPASSPPGAAPAPAGSGK